VEGDRVGGGQELGRKGGGKCTVGGKRRGEFPKVAGRRRNRKTLHNITYYFPMQKTQRRQPTNGVGN